MKLRNLPTIAIMTLTALGIGLSCTVASADPKSFPDPAVDLPKPLKPETRSVVLAGGCFWCTEGVFEGTPGVIDVVSGYAGGTAESANYQAVGGGRSTHAEVIKVTYDPQKVSFGTLLKLFFSIAHDPTTLNRQGPDSGTQYRSAIFYENDEQLNVAKAYIAQLDGAKVYSSPIVTTLEKLDTFYPAEQYHQDFVRLNPSHPYIVQQALPKIAKAQKFVETIKTPTTQVTSPTTQSSN